MTDRSPAAWRADRRTTVVAVGLPLVGVVLCVAVWSQHLGRAELFGLGLYVLASWLPLALVRTGWPFRVATGLWMAVMVVVLLFVPIAVVSMLPLAIGAFLPRPRPGLPTFGPVVGSIVVTVVGVLVVGLVVFPANGRRIAICFDQEPYDEVGSSIYATHSSRGWDMRPGVDSVGAAGDTTIFVEFEPFVSDENVEAVVRRADAHPHVVGYTSEDRSSGTCPAPDR